KTSPRPPSRCTNTASGCCSCWCWRMPAPPSTTTSSRATTPCAACCPRCAATTRPPDPIRRTDPMHVRNRVLPLALAAAFAAAPAAAADYVQVLGALSFASEYQGETFVGLFPDFSTTLSFDPAAPEHG